MIVFIVSAVVLGLWVQRRRARARVLSGLDGTRPVFSVEPPNRRLGSRRTEAL